MSKVQPKAVCDPAERLPGRHDMALYGIYEISKILCGPGDLRGILVATLGVMSSFLDMVNGLISLPGDGGDDMLVAGNACLGAIRYSETLPEKVLAQIIATGVPLAVGDVALDPHNAWDTSGWGHPGQKFSFLGVPIKDRGHVIGTLSIDLAWSACPSPHMDDDLRFLKMVASLVGQAVRLHRLVTRDRARMLEDQSRLDKDLPADAGRCGHQHGIIGESPAVRAVMEKLRLVARRDTSVLLQGESGTGKELFACALHRLSARRDGPFIKLNCAVLPESMLESELFGHEKGSFTGAIVQRRGRFELANGGTLFMDEISETSPAFQAKLLRVLQEGEFERVGGNRTLKVNVRLVTATNRNLEEAVSKGAFRADLYYRINVVPIRLPPLRERREDIPLLASEFLRRFNADNETRLSLEPSAMEVLSRCYFPGNIRELENCIRRTATLARGERLTGADFACSNDSCLSSVLWKVPGPCAVPAGDHAPVPPPMPPVPAAMDPRMPQAWGSGTGSLPTRSELVGTMEKCGWVQAKAARMMGLTPRQVGYAVRKHCIDIPVL